VVTGKIFDTFFTTINTSKHVLGPGHSVTCARQEKTEKERKLKCENCEVALHIPESFKLYIAPYSAQTLGKSFAQIL
jgi:hypothetical protein